MNHHRRPHSGSRVRWTGSEKPELLVVGEGYRRAQLLVDPLERGVRFGKGEARAQRLQSEMILFIYHDACPCPKKHGGPRSHRMLRVQTRQFPTHQMSLVQQEPVIAREIIYPHHDVMLETGRRANGLAHARQHAQPLTVAGPARERKSLEIAREADACGQYDAGVIRSEEHTSELQSPVQ